ncbi:hypothetical protein [Kribbella sindirgiensis]|uniref:hypothetical protein n=1 Tax=Kribbella sindirgiensis TaxID=1124744 RepID=UPI00192E067E|nr:hypothetical protein [Kribbella sindirgiensis]
MDKVVKVCDVCEDLTRPVQIYTVGSADGRVADPPPTLCAEHAAPLEAFLPQAQSAPAKPTPARKAPAKKAAAKKAAAKKAAPRGKARRTLSLEEIG